MNKVELANKIAEKVGVSKKEAEQMLTAFVDIVTDTLKNDGTVTIAGFGAFSSRVRAGRIGVNPQNPSEEINIPPVKVPKFKAGKTLKDELKGKKTTPKLVMQQPTAPIVEPQHTEPAMPQAAPIMPPVPATPPTQEPSTPPMPPVNPSQPQM